MKMMEVQELLEQRSIYQHIELFLKKRGAQKISQKPNESYFGYVAVIEPGRKIKIKSKIKTTTNGCTFSLVSRPTLPKNIDNSKEILKLANQFNARANTRNSKLCYDKNLGLVQIVINFSLQCFPEDLSKCGSRISVHLENLESDLSEFIQQIEKLWNSPPKKVIQDINNSIQNLKKLIDNNIRARQNSKLAQFIGFQIKEKDINTSIEINSQGELKKSINFSQLQKQYLKLIKSTSKKSEQQLMILQKIQVLKKICDQKWNEKSGSFGSIKKWNAEYLINFQSIHQKTNKDLQAEITDLSKCRVDGCLVEKSIKCLTDKHAIESFKTQAAIVRYLRNQSQETIASYYYVQGLNANEDYLDTFLLDYYPLSLDQAILNQQSSLHVSTMLAKGLKFLQTFNVLHRDLKPQNIMLSSYFTPKTIDFGSAYILKRNKYQNQVSSVLRTSRRYNLVRQDIDSLNMSVAQFQEHPNFDIYAFGMIINQLILQNDFSDTLPIAMRKHVTWIYHRCKDMNPQNRPDAKLVHMYMTLVNKYSQIYRQIKLLTV